MPVVFSLARLQYSGCNCTHPAYYSGTEVSDYDSRRDAGYYEYRQIQEQPCDAHDERGEYDLTGVMAHSAGDAHADHTEYARALPPPLPQS